MREAALASCPPLLLALMSWMSASCGSDDPEPRDCDARDCEQAGASSGEGGAEGASEGGARGDGDDDAAGRSSGGSQSPGSGGTDEASAGASSGGGASAGAPGAECELELLVAGGFDEASAWEQTAVPSNFQLILRADAASALLGFEVSPPSEPNLVWLGGIEGDTQSVSQSVTIPAGAKTLILSGTVWVGTEQADLSNGDRAALGFVDAFGAGTDFVTFTPADATDDWTTFSDSMPSGELAGQQLDFGLASVTDGSANTNFFFDSLSLVANVCE
jgi:hypothetical protein